MRNLLECVAYVVAFLGVIVGCLTLLKLAEM